MDFYEIWLLSRQFDFDGVILAGAIEKTFTHRGTTVTPEPTAFSLAFATDASKPALVLDRTRLAVPAR